MHRHHIIPRYEGGSDFSENIVELTVTQHALWHFAEWQRKGNWQDKVAWKTLVGQSVDPETWKERAAAGGLAAASGYKMSEEGLEEAQDIVCSGGVQGDGSQRKRTHSH